MSKLKSLYTKQILSVKETISSGELSTIDANDISKINTLLLEKVKNKIGNRCNESGYVNKDSINIVSRSVGSINSSTFNGDIIYNLDLEADVCIPTEGNRFKCKVSLKTKWVSWQLNIQFMLSSHLYITMSLMYLVILILVILLRLR